MPDRRWALCVTPERAKKTRMLMDALRRGWPDGTRLALNGRLVGRREPFIVWGQEFLAERLIPPALIDGRPFWHIDNGFWQPARGTPQGYYRFTFRGPGAAPVPAPLWRQALAAGRAEWPLRRLRDWRRDGEHVVLALPGPTFGKAYGLDMAAWSRTILGRLRRMTNRPIRIRDKRTVLPLSRDLEGAWALVTHSSMAAVEAAIAGIPVLVETPSAAAGLGNVLRADTEADIEHLVLADREPWLAALSCQHFTLAEMADGTAWEYLGALAAPHQEN